MATIPIPAGTIPNVGPDCAAVTAVDDSLVEGPEEFDIVITGATMVSIGSADTTTVTIIDNDDGEFCKMCVLSKHNVDTDSVNRNEDHELYRTTERCPLQPTLLCSLIMY